MFLLLGIQAAVTDGGWFWRNVTLVIADIDILETGLEMNSTVNQAAVDMKLWLEYWKPQTNVFDKGVLGVQQRQSSPALLVAARIY